ncbi:hypothetical protein GCM10025867_49990 (plasmid) [Frondihabitans sucicola]|uniref:GmrSD restriction endonucleases N-terminal domain-containing protein n=1 Tax=Frondihabitans sucicola TaxID=1268041 RepID=A0ABM8GWA6_9MICO|nr:DUF262 domain-containing protein [Frondihabitans sucicola]BDZ52758.1 hypothetical protein GCM10025867_49990 [Frondihabitans sucicola]
MTIIEADGSDSYGAEIIEDEDKPQFTVAECPIEGWRGPRRKRPDAAQDDADRHNEREHPNAKKPKRPIPTGLIGNRGLPKIPAQNLNFDMLDIIERVRQGKTIVSPPYQRDSVWTLEQRQALMASWIIGLPIPAIVVNSRFRGGWNLSGDDAQTAVIDGKQRIETALAWLDNKFSIPAAWLDSDDFDSVQEFSMVSFENLTHRGRNTALPIPMVETSVGTIEEEAAIYLMVNAAGTPQSIADIAKARRYSYGA